MSGQGGGKGWMFGEGNILIEEGGGNGGLWTGNWERGQHLKCKQKKSNKKMAT